MPEHGRYDDPSAQRDTIRLLHRHAAHGYTTNPTMALRHEPEALSETDQRFLERAAATTREQRTRDALDRRRQQLQREADWHAAQARNRERELARLDRRLGTA